MVNTLAHEEFTARMDRAELYAANPRRKGEEQRDMVSTAQALQNCGYADIEQRANRLLAYINFEVVLNLVEGFASNPNRKAEEYRDMIPTAEKLLGCGFADIEQRARQVVQELTRKQNTKKWWRFWK